MTRVLAHRGAHRHMEENSLGAFRAAIDLGVDGVEFDLRRTADGALVIHHDPTVDGRVIALSAADELPPYVARLDEAMAVLRGLIVNVEIKNSRSAEEPTYDDQGVIASETLEFLSTEGWMESVILSCFDQATCDRLRAQDANAQVAWLVDDGLLDNALREASDHGFDAVNPHYFMVTPEAAALARELGLSLNPWTVNRSSDLVVMAELGVASVITDEPELALDLLNPSQ